MISLLPSRVRNRLKAGETGINIHTYKQALEEKLVKSKLVKRSKRFQVNSHLSESLKSPTRQKSKNPVLRKIKRAQIDLNAAYTGDAKAKSPLRFWAPDVEAEADSHGEYRHFLLELERGSRTSKSRAKPDRPGSFQAVKEMSFPGK